MEETVNDMDDLLAYIDAHTTRGECQCGKCCDRGPERDAPLHSVNVHFFWVAAQNEPKAAELRELLVAHYPAIDRLEGGPSYIEIGAEVGSQDRALRLIGLGGLVGLWDVITPEAIGMTGETANELAGSGFVMCSGLSGKEPEGIKA